MATVNTVSSRTGFKESKFVLPLTDTPLMTWLYTVYTGAAGPVGLIDGTKVTGAKLGSDEGSTVGFTEGSTVGSTEGSTVGYPEGMKDGSSVGLLVTRG